MTVGFKAIWSSTTWAAGLMSIAMWAGLNALGVPLPIEAALGLVGIYGAKEGAAKIGDGLAAKGR